VSTKTPQGLCSSISQENSLYIEWGNFPPRTTSPIMWEDIPLCEEKYSTLTTRGLCFQASVFLTSSKHANAHTGWQEPQSDHKNSLHVDKEILFDLRNTPKHTGCSQVMLSIPWSMKLLPSLQWTAAFRNTRNYGIPWSTQEGHSFLQRFSQGGNTTPFIHGTEQLKSERLKAVHQTDLGK
jgi:hypothetical protein